MPTRVRSVIQDLSERLIELQESIATRLQLNHSAYPKLHPPRSMPGVEQISNRPRRNPITPLQ